MQLEHQIHEKLTAAFAPQQLVVRNVSQRHAHHEHTHGVSHTGETHFHVTIVSDKFKGKSRVERHRMVHEVLAEELAGPVHSLAVKAAAPAENADG